MYVRMVEGSLDFLERSYGACTDKPFRRFVSMMMMMKQKKKRKRPGKPGDCHGVPAAFLFVGRRVRCFLGLK